MARIEEVLPDPRLRMCYSVEECVQILPLSRQTIYNLINKEQIPAKKIGRRTVILHDDLIAFLKHLPEYRAEDKMS